MRRLKLLEESVTDLPSAPERNQMTKETMMAVANLGGHRIKAAVKIVVEIMAEAITNKLTKLAVCKQILIKIVYNFP